MNPIKKGLADFLARMARKAIDTMDPESPCARALKGLDRDAILENDIQHICNDLSILEAGKVLRLASKALSSSAEDADRHRKEIRSMVSEVMKRVEKKTGSLNLPPECRDLLMNTSFSVSIVERAACSFDKLFEP